MFTSDLTTATVSTQPHQVTPEAAYQAGSCWIVFSDQAPVWWARFLKGGFRHCFMIQRDGLVWRVFDPHTHPPKLVTLPFPSSFDLPGWLQNQGLLVVATNTPPALHQLRLTTPWTTPWRLYRRLLRLSQQMLTPAIAN